MRMPGLPGFARGLPFCLSECTPSARAPPGRGLGPTLRGLAAAWAARARRLGPTLYASGGA
eukprot:CAMPEP_0179317032 /NCGR_PEP_ID=MMETSP0797-20121207/56030_1 /TAXON_ID=47934 /ORGANISM="Dinophysis acuminata, Strain DAEP01" /LENGTH=60 /DNA_ID=CAMNT_0021027899 /DNA_START=32 /DNA_END=211 /DNA_ORIENTATION=+